MQALKLVIPEVVLFTAKLFGDDRVFFYESFGSDRFAA